MFGSTPSLCRAVRTGRAAVVEVLVELLLVLVVPSLSDLRVMKFCRISGRHFTKPAAASYEIDVVEIS